MTEEWTARTRPGGHAVAPVDTGDSGVHEAIRGRRQQRCGPSDGMCHLPTYTDIARSYHSGSNAESSVALHCTGTRGDVAVAASASASRRGRASVGSTATPPPRRTSSAAPAVRRQTTGQPAQRASPTAHGAESRILGKSRASAWGRTARISGANVVRGDGLCPRVRGRGCPTQSRFSSGPVPKKCSSHPTAAGSAMAVRARWTPFQATSRPTKTARRCSDPSFHGGGTTTSRSGSCRNTLGRVVLLIPRFGPKLCRVGVLGDDEGSSPCCTESAGES